MFTVSMVRKNKSVFRVLVYGGKLDTHWRDKLYHFPDLFNPMRLVEVGDFHTL